MLKKLDICLKQILKYWKNQVLTSKININNNNSKYTNIQFPK